jgi:hypothetical protein
MKKTNKAIDIKDPKTGFTISYSMDTRLKKNLEEKVIPALEKQDKDYVLAVDGKEGGGKSTLAFQIGKFVDPSLDLSRIVFSADEFREAIFKAKKGQCVIYDEAFTGFSSRSSLSSINRVLVSLMMQMRQKNLFVIIVLPTFFLLDKYVALFRARALVHVFESKGERGFFKVYNTRLKKMLYLAGKKTMSYYHKHIRTNFFGRFYGKFAIGDEKVEAVYRKKKQVALEESEKNPMTAGQVKYKEQRDIVIYCLRKYSKMTYKELANYLDEFDLGISLPQIAKICGKFGDVDEKKEKRKEEAPKNEKKSKKPKVIEKERVERKPNHIYYVDEDGNIIEKPMEGERLMDNVDEIEEDEDILDNFD